MVSIILSSDWILNTKVPSAAISNPPEIPVTFDPLFGFSSSKWSWLQESVRVHKNVNSNVEGISVDAGKVCR